MSGKGATVWTGATYEIQDGCLIRCTNVRERPVDPLLIIPNGVREIGRKAFRLDQMPVSIIFPKGLTDIGEEAFWGCFSLEKIRFPAGLQKIQRNAFCCCSSLERVVLPEGLQELAPLSFGFCDRLREVYLPATLDLSDLSPFEESSHLERLSVTPGVPFLRQEGPLILSANGTNVLFCQRNAEGTVRIPDGVKSIGRAAFERCQSLIRVQCPESLQEIGTRAFARCSWLEEVQLPAAMTELGNFAFFRCGALKSLKIPDGVSRVGDGVFEECRSLTSLRLPSSLTTVENAFSHCESLKELVVPASVDVFRSTLEDCEPERLSFVGPAFAVDPNRLHLSRGAELVLDWFPFADLNSERKLNVACGILRRLSDHIPVREKTLQDSLPYIRENAQVFWQKPDYRIPLLQQGYLTPATYDSILESTLKQMDAPTPELMALLLEYPERFFTPEERAEQMQAAFSL